MNLRTPVEKKNIDDKPAMGVGEETGSKFKLTTEKGCPQKTPMNLTKYKKAKKFNNIVKTSVVKPVTPDVATAEQTPVEVADAPVRRKSGRASKPVIQHYSMPEEMDEEM